MVEPASSLRILHISDTHFGGPRPTSEKAVIDALPAAFRDGALQAARPDLIVHTGDLAWSGQRLQYEAAEAWLRSLLSACNLSPGSLFLVPGNHDLSRADVPRCIVPALDDEEVANMLEDREVEYRPFLVPLREYAELEYRLHGTAVDVAGRTRSAMVQVNGWHVAILLINTATFAHEKNCQGRLFVGEKRVRAAVDRMSGPRPPGKVINIALAHHPLDYLIDYDRHATHSLIVDACDVFCHGHMHHAAHTQHHSGGSSCLTISAGATHDVRNGNLAFLIEVSVDDICVRPIAYASHGERGWREHATALSSMGPVRFARHLVARAAASDGSSARLQNYLEHFAAKHSRVSWLDRTGHSNSLELDLRAVYLKLHVMSKPERIESLQDAVMQSSCVVLIGLPGSGKTTFLRYLGLDCLSAARRPGSTSWVPILVSARDVVAALKSGFPESSWQPQDVLDSIAAALGKSLTPLTREQMGELLKEGRARLMVDALDEIGLAHDRALFSRALDNLASSLAAAAMPFAIIATTRPASYKGAAVLGPQFRALRVAPLSREDISQFTQLWARAVYRLPVNSPLSGHPQASADQRGLERALWASPSLRQLVSTPVLLSTCAAVYQRRGTLAGSRAWIYREATDMLLERFVKVGDFGVPELRRVLSRAAYEFRMQLQAQEGPRVREEESVVELFAHELECDRRTARDFLWDQELRSGILVAREPGTYEFVHPSFSEYFAAAHIADMARSDQATILFQRAGDPSWREVFRFLLGILTLDSPSRWLALKGQVVALCGSDVERVSLLSTMATWVTDINPRDLPSDAWRAERALGDGIVDAVRSPARTLDQRAAAAQALALAGDPRIGRPPEGLVDATLYNHGRRLLVAKFPVTCAEFAAYRDGVMARGGQQWQIPDRTEVRDYDYVMTALGNTPVVYVSWHEAIDYCKWLNAEWPCENGLEWRLPLSAEWELVARVGRNVRFPWGDEADTEKADVWSAASPRPRPLPVGCFAAGMNPLGVWDLSGSVWEWCLDERASVSIGASSVTLSDMRVVKGGSWRGGLEAAAIDAIDWVQAKRRVDDVGFRVVQGDKVK